MSPDFDELVGTEPIGREREGMRLAHELLVRAGPPPELTPALEAGPNLDVVHLQQRRRVKRRALLLLAATLSIIAVFAAGYAVADHRGGTASPTAQLTLGLRGTVGNPNARATLEVWRPREGNRPMKLSVVGLPKLPAHTYYEVYIVRNGKPWGSCGTFVVSGPTQALTVTLNAPFKLQRGDSWIVTRAAPGSEPGKTVLRPVSA